MADKPDEYIEQITILKIMFGDTVAEDVISAVIESCNGDVNIAADAIMNMSHENDNMDVVEESKNSEVSSAEGNETSQKVAAPVAPGLNNSTISTTANKTDTQSVNTFSGLSQQFDTLSTSFAEAFRSTGAVPKKPQEINPQKILRRQNDIWSEELKKIFHLHNQGTRTLILLRGAPGSGKSYMGKYIIDTTLGPSQRNYENHMFSSDSYFMRGGVYQFDRNFLEIAHMTNQRKVCDATNKGVSPIIVDNTNTAIWEMEPYFRDGIRNGYVIMFVEPNTPWARNAYQLAKRNTHNVPLENIRRMLDNFERCTVEGLMKCWRLSYPPHMKPPVKRCFPPVTEKSPRPSAVSKNPPMQPILKKDIPAILFPEFSKPPPVIERRTKELQTLSKVEYDRNTPHSPASASTARPSQHIEVVHHKSPDSPDHEIQAASCIEAPETSSNNDKELKKSEEDIKIQKIVEAQKKMEIFEKIEREWEAGASWDTATNYDRPNSLNQALTLDPKPPRAAETRDCDTLIQQADICDDWTKITAFMPPWQDDKMSVANTYVEDIPVQMTDATTSIELSDLHSGINKVLSANSRNINQMNNPSKAVAKKPTKIMIDKSTSTHEYDFYTECVSECKNTEQHFRAFRRLFSTVPRLILRDVFDSCRGDVNWAVNIILDSYPDTKINEKNDNLSESEDDEPIDECHCLAAYNIIPNVKSNAPLSPVLASENISQSLPATPVTQKKPKRETILSESSMQLKRQIESNVMISDDHYSQHYLNTRRRRDENNISGQRKLPSHKDPMLVVTSDVEIPEEENARALQQNTLRYNLDFNDSDSDSDMNESKTDTMVSVNIGHELQNKLDELFGMEGFPYPENIKPIVNIPMSLLREINAYWQESLAFQLEEQANQSEVMIKQDEEFARQLVAKEEEMYREGQKPDMPSLKEIMDMEMAYSIYEKNVSEWRNKEPQDMASRLSREKLFNLFPDLSHDVLSELLMAHEYNFKATVESLLISTGHSEMLEDEKGIEKFVMQKELERKEKFLQEEKKTLAKSVWPFTNEPDRPITLETVEYYRTEAEKSLNYRNMNFNKARVYFERNIPSAATFFSDIAALHTKKYEQNSALAAAYLMSYHVNKNPNQDVVDLHFLRVTEALVTMDIFIDKIIVKLRDESLPAKTIYIITGRGQHSSNGAPRIKPAAKRRLQARRIYYREINPGLLAGKLSSGHKITNELQ